MKNFYPVYFQQYKDLAFNEFIYKTIESISAEALKIKSKDGKIIFAGNGASAAISAHAAIDAIIGKAVYEVS